jgi:hypothetical protein
MMNRLNFLKRSPARSASVFVTALALWTQAHAIDFGVNIHYGGTPQFNAQRAAVMKERNFKSARMDFISFHDVAALRDQAQRIRANGGSVEVVLWTRFGNDHSCTQNLAAVESSAYADAAQAVDKIKDLVYDFELLNETEQRPDVGREVARNSAGMSTVPYHGKPCVAALAAALRGMSRAIRDIRSSSGLPLRVMYGQSGRDWGLLTYMQQQGVEWDVTIWHLYQKLHSPSLLSDTWWGPGGPLTQLASFGKPIRINEFNCGETYEAGYENRAGQAVTETCLRSIARQLRELTAQTIANIESISVYELLDEPEKGKPEGVFGTMYNMASAKPHLYLFTAFAGGTLTAAERFEITSRGLMTDGEIDARARR